MTRSLLYVPGDRPDRFDKAAASGADAIILDLEDAVAMQHKDEARAAVATWLAARAPGVAAWVRVNGGELMGKDVHAIADHVDGVYLPKASVEALDMLDALLGPVGTPACALVETAAGVLDARAIASHQRVARLAIGEADLGAELAVDPSPDAREFAGARAMVVLASSAAGIDQPVGPVSTDFRDLDAFRASTDALRRAGFGARAAIHPAQVPVINEAFTPGEDEVEAARRVLELFEKAGGGVCVDDDGRMVDEAIVRAARRTLARAGEV